MNKLQIAIGATLHKKVYIDSNGGTEAFVYFLSRELVRRGHSVTMYAASESEVEGTLRSIASINTISQSPQGQKLFLGYQLLESQMIASSQQNYDILHINYYEPYLFTAFSKLILKPVIYTIHSDIFISDEWQKLTLQMLKSTDRIIFVSRFAMNQAKLLQNKDYVYNGINTALFPFAPLHGNNLLWLGRVRQKKGVKEAVQTAIKANEKLLLSGVIDNDEEQLFFNNEVAPLLVNKDNLKFLGPSGFKQKIKLYQNAKALLVPISWEEPFGLVSIEAMACGTPVIAFARGAVPEIVVDGVTGYIVNSSDEDTRGNWLVKKTGIEGLVEAIKKLNSLSETEYQQMRLNCRKRIEEKFTIEKMVDGYEKVYQRILNKPPR